LKSATKWYKIIQEKTLASRKILEDTVLEASFYAFFTLISKGERAESWNSEFLWISRILWDSIGFSTSQDSLRFPEMP
jgi:hypothetical protein